MEVGWRRALQIKFPYHLFSCRSVIPGYWVIFLLFYSWQTRAYQVSAYWSDLPHPDKTRIWSGKTMCPHPPPPPHPQKARLWPSTCKMKRHFTQTEIGFNLVRWRDWPCTNRTKFWLGKTMWLSKFRTRI